MDANVNGGKPTHEEKSKNYEKARAFSNSIFK